MVKFCVRPVSLEQANEIAKKVWRVLFPWRLKTFLIANLLCGLFAAALFFYPAQFQWFWPPLIAESEIFTYEQCLKAAGAGLHGPCQPPLQQMRERYARGAKNCSKQGIGMTECRL